jgi:hypothetical protein
MDATDVSEPFFRTMMVVLVLGSTETVTNRKSDGEGNMTPLPARSVPPTWSRNSLLPTPPPSDIYLARRYHACGSFRHKAAKATLLRGDLDDAIFWERQAIGFFLHSMHCLDLGGVGLDFNLPRIWEEFAEAGLEPWADYPCTRSLEQKPLNR